MGFFRTLITGLIDIVCGGPSSRRPQEEDQHVHVPHRPQTQTSPPNDQAYPVVEVERPQAHAPVQHAKPQPKPKHSGSPPRQRPQKRVDQKQVNQQNEYYTSLRARANEAGDSMAQSFEGSHQAYANRDGALAKELSVQGKKHQQEMDRLNQEASEWIFTENNKDSGLNEVDLHGLYVKEAITYADRAIQEARRRGDFEIQLIVGKGLHSRGGIAKLKPAIEDLIQKHRLVAQLDPQNAGVLIVTLDGSHTGAGKIMNLDDITRGIESKEEGCTIM